MGHRSKRRVLAPQELKQSLWSICCQGRTSVFFDCRHAGESDQNWWWKNITGCEIYDMETFRIRWLTSCVDQTKKLSSFISRLGLHSHDRMERQNRSWHDKSVLQSDCHWEEQICGRSILDNKMQWRFAFKCEFFRKEDSRVWNPWLGDTSLLVPSWICTHSD